MKKAAENRISGGELISSVYLCLLSVALPLAVHKAYFDITLTKARVFWALSILFVAASAIFLIIRLFKEPNTLRSPRPALPDLLFSLFALTHILSSLLFRSSPALLAPDNRYQGILSFVLYLPVFLSLRRFCRFSSLVRYALLLGFSLAALLGILDIFDLSILPLRAVSPEIELPRFLSTVGNISFFSALCVLFLPLSAYWALSVKEFKAALPYALCALLALCGGLAARAESFLLGALFFFALIPLFSRDELVLRRVPLLWAFSSAAAMLFSLAMTRFALYLPSELTRLICASVPMLALSILSAAAYLWLRGKNSALVQRVRKGYVIVFWTLAAAALVFLLLANTLWRDALSDSPASFAVFSPSWGSDRGAEWVSFWQMFLSSPLSQKLIGSGAGSLADWDRAHRLFSDAVTDSAHNEYLHYLLTGGLIGCLSYLALIVLALRRALTCPSREKTALALSCAAYALQAFVNIAQPFTTPLFFAFLALLLSDGEDGEKSEAESALFWRVALAALAAALLIAAATSA